MANDLSLPIADLPKIPSLVVEKVLSYLNYGELLSCKLVSKSRNDTVIEFMGKNKNNNFTTNYLIFDYSTWTTRGEDGSVETKVFGKSESIYNLSWFLIASGVCSILAGISWNHGKNFKTLVRIDSKHLQFNSWKLVLVKHLFSAPSEIHLDQLISNGLFEFAAKNNAVQWVGDKDNPKLDETGEYIIKT